MGSSLLFITLTVSLSSLGSLIQPSHSVDVSDSVRMTRRTGSDGNAQHSLSSGVTVHSDGLEGSGQSVDSRASQTPEQANNAKHAGSGMTTTPALTLPPPGAHRTNTSFTRYLHSRVRILSEKALSHDTPEEQLEGSYTSIIHDDFTEGLSSDLGSPKRPDQNNAFTSMTNQIPAGPCVLSLSPCVIPQTFNGTSLLWDDMRRTLAFAWELHVFGSATLFILMAILAAMGMAGACLLPYPVCDTLILANSLLVLCGTLRGVLLLLDPYGTRQILSHATLAALHNIPLQFLLWTQVTLTLVTVRGLNLLLFPLKLQCPWVLGGLAISHCTALIIADLFSPTFSLTLPLLLQTLSLCWGLPFCMGILPQICSHLHPFQRSSIPQWGPSHAIEKRAKRVIAVCAFLGVICCTLQMYTLLWLYGLLGNWRRFGWGWWLSQFWARILELSWGFSLLVLGSWMFWMPPRSHAWSDQGQSRSEASKEGQERSLWGRFLASIRKGPLRKSEQTWEDLMPSNWTKYNLSGACFSKNIMCPYDDHPSTFLPEYEPEPDSISPDSQATIMWQKVGEHECVLSLIEFDMRPLSPINLRRSIDEALHHGQLVAGDLFTAPPPSWTEAMGTDTTDGDGGTTTFPPPYVGYSWTLDTESINAPLDHFQAEELLQLPRVTIDYNGDDGSMVTADEREELNSVLSAVMYQHDWCFDDVTDV